LPRKREGIYYDEKTESGSIPNVTKRKQDHNTKARGCMDRSHKENIQLKQRQGHPQYP